MIVRFTKNIFAVELSRAINSRRFGLAFAFGSLILLVGYFTTARSLPEKSYIDHWYQIYLQSYYSYLIPLLVALPYADSLVLDRKEGFIRAILARSNYKSYAWAKIVANGIAGGVAAGLPMAISYGLLSLFNKNPLNHPALNTIYLRPQEGILGELFREHPNLFFLAVIGAIFLMGFLWATFGLSASLVINNRYIALGLPFLFAGVLQYFVERTLRLPWFLAPIESLLKLNYNKNHLMSVEDIKFVLILPLLLLAVSALLWLTMGRRDVVVQENGFPLRIALSTSDRSGNRKLILRAQKKQRTNRAKKAWFQYLLLQSKLLLKPYLLIGIIVVVLAVGFLFGKIITNASAISIVVLPGSEGLPNATAWDVFFSAIGNAYSMGLVFTPMLLLLVSNLQPESAYGQMAAYRLKSRSGIVWAKLALLSLVVVAYLVLVTILILLVGKAGFGFSLKPVWSRLAYTSPENVNMMVQWVTKYTMLAAYFKLILMIGLGYLGLGLLVVAINSLSKRRLIGFFVAIGLVLASFGLAYVLASYNVWVTQLPVIRNLILPMFPWPWRLRDTSNISIFYWVLWILGLLPICYCLLRKQEFYSLYETE